MTDLDLMRSLTQTNTTKIVLLVMDGLGGLPKEPGGPTELEAAFTPHLDRLAAEGMAGLMDTVGVGISPGSGPGHLGLFGYDPLKYLIGRGVLEAVGIGLALTDKDVAARGNFCTVDEQGIITDRRAGRISTEACARMVGLIEDITLPGVELIVKPVRDYRFALVLRGSGLSPHLNETDPAKDRVQTTGRGTPGWFDRSPAHCRSGQPMGGKSAGAHQGRTAGQHGHTSGVGQRTGPAVVGECVQTQGCRSRGLPDVQRFGQPGGHDASPGPCDV